MKLVHVLQMIKSSDDGSLSTSTPHILSDKEKNNGLQEWNMSTVTIVLKQKRVQLLVDLLVRTKTSKNKLSLWFLPAP